MNDSTQNVPETIRQEAKARALKVIEANKSCALCFKIEDLDTQPLFYPVVVAIKPIKEDFHEYIPDIGILPKVPLQSTFLRENDIKITRTDHTKESKYVYIAHAFGEKRMSDGTMRPADATYRYDCEARAKRDFLKDQIKSKDKQKYVTEYSREKHLNDLDINADSIAETGAHWRLARRLGCIPASFKTAEELMRGLLVMRVERDNAAMIALATQNPAIGMQVLDNALGAKQLIYGPKQLEAVPTQRTVDIESGEIIKQPPAGELFEDDIPEMPPEKTPLDSAREVLAGFRETFKRSSKALKLIGDTLDKKDPASTLDEVNGAIDLLSAYLQQKKGGA